MDGGSRSGKIRFTSGEDVDENDVFRKTRNPAALQSDLTRANRSVPISITERPFANESNPRGIIGGAEIIFPSISSSGAMRY